MPFLSRIISGLFVCAVLIFTRPVQVHSEPQSQLGDSVVKIFVTSNRMDYFRPWQAMGTQSSSGSGCIISGNRILTNAHVVDAATFIQVRKESDPRKYTAKVEVMGHDADLALLTVSDPEFFVGTVPAEMGPLPFLQDQVVVVGFPEGGDKVSISGGVVSRIENIPYSNSGKRLLGVQIDAAINPGNSGGPVYQNGKVIGIAMQVINNAQNIGYIIPTPIINHFLNDWNDKSYDGFPFLGIETKNAENKSLREYYKVPEQNSGGVLITNVIKFSSADQLLKDGDFLLEIDGTQISVDGTYEFRKGERLAFSYLISSKFVGDSLAIKVVRDGKMLNESVRLKKTKDLVAPPKHYEKPSYYIYGGLVFSVLSADLMKSWGNNWWEKAPVPYLNYLVGKGALNAESKKDVVVLLDVLADDISVGYFDYGNEVISKVNGQTFSSFEEFVKLVEKNTSKFCVFETEQKFPLIISTERIDEITSEILRRNNIPSQYSADVAHWLQIRKP